MSLLILFMININENGVDETGVKLWGGGYLRAWTKLRSENSCSSTKAFRVWRWSSSLWDRKGKKTHETRANYLLSQLKPVISLTLLVLLLSCLFFRLSPSFLLSWLIFFLHLFSSCLCHKFHFCFSSVPILISSSFFSHICLIFIFSLPSTFSVSYPQWLPRPFLSHPTCYCPPLSLLSS